MTTRHRILLFSIAMIFLAVQVHAYPQGGKTSPNPGTPASASSKALKGTVLETMNAAGYTYLHLEENGEKFWAAIPESDVKVGEKVELGASMEMHNFTSKTLNRTFDTITFSQGLIKN